MYYPCGYYGFFKPVEESETVYCAYGSPSNVLQYAEFETDYIDNFVPDIEQFKLLS